MKKKWTYTSSLKVLISYLAGLTSFSLGLSLCVITGLGLAPWDVFAQGISVQLNINFGMANIVTSFIVLVFAAFFKVIPGIGTFSNIIIIGLLIDVFLYILNTYFVISSSYFVLIPIYIIGLFFMALGSVLYIIPRFGAGPRDSLLLGIIQKTKMNITYIKPLMEGVVLVIGIYIGGTVGIGTIINLVILGYFMVVFFRYYKFDPKVVKQYNFIEQIEFIKEAIVKNK